jgi:multiple sugar transport system permease protein
MAKQSKKRLGTALYILGLAALFAGIVFIILKNSSLYPVFIISSACLTATGLYLNHSYQTKLGTFKLLQHFFLTIGAVIMVFPFYWMIASAFKTSAEMNLFPPTMAPKNWLNFDNFVIAFNTAPFARYFINSVITCLSSVAITTLTTILAAFAFSRLNFPGKEIIFSLLLSMMMVPFEILVITNYTTIVKLGINDTLWALILPFTSSIFYTYILRNFFQSIPDGLYWSARVDGCSNWRYLWKVMVPIAKPSLSTIVLLNAMASWNSFMWPMLVIKQDTNRTLPFGLYTFTTEVGANNELLMAASSVVVLPMILVFIFARKQIVGGVARGGIKG